MSHADHILKDAELAQFMETHQGAADAIHRASDQVAEAPDGVSSVQKLLPALSQKVIFVFFSYKKKNEQAARAVVDVLRKCSAEKSQITYQAEFAEEIAGKQWREKIRESVGRANWFSLLLPDPSDDWDWCLYETGLFDRQPRSSDRLICLHHPDTRIPSPIEDYHAVPATIHDLQNFLRMVYVRDDPIPGMDAINRSIEPHIESLAREIVDAIRSPKKSLVRRVLEPWVELSIGSPVELQSKDDLDDAVIVSTNQEALDLFDYITQPTTWRELHAGVGQGASNDRWRDELFHVVRRIARGRRFFPIQSVLCSKDGRMYRPVACAIDRLGETGAISSFHITFVEDVGALDLRAIPDETADLATLLRFVFRFRWEVLERFGNGPMMDDDVERLDYALRRIKME